MQQRRQFQLPPHDVEFLDSYGKPWETITDGSQWVLIHDFSNLTSGYNHDSVIVAIRIETGYPNVKLDMAYFYPPLERTDRKLIPASNVKQSLDGKTFQRWSRHYSKENPFNVGYDGLERHILAIEDWLMREFEEST